jgi:hypothetical protein
VVPACEGWPYSALLAPLVRKPLLDLIEPGFGSVHALFNLPVARGAIGETLDDGLRVTSIRLPRSVSVSAMVRICSSRRVSAASRRTRCPARTPIAESMLACPSASLACPSASLPCPSASFPCPSVKAESNAFNSESMPESVTVSRLFGQTEGIQAGQRGHSNPQRPLRSQVASMRDKPYCHLRGNAGHHRNDVV